MTPSPSGREAAADAASKVLSVSVRRHERPHRLRLVTAIAQLEENRTVEGVYAVARKERLRTRAGAPYLALELVDPSGRITARVCSDVELLDARFAEGDAVRVLGRVERYRDRLQLDVRTLEAAQGADPAAMAPATPKARNAARFTDPGEATPDPTSRIGPTRSASVPRMPSE